MTFIEALLVKILAALVVRLVWALIEPEIKRRLLAVRSSEEDKED